MTHDRARIRTSSIALFVFFSVIPRPCLPCTCCFSEVPSVSVSAQDADSVFQGTVLSIESSEAIEYFLDVTFEVSRVWKGPVAPRLVTITGQDCGICGVHFEEGLEYIVYAHRSADRVEASLCSRTGLQSDAETEALGPPCASGDGLENFEGGCPQRYSFLRGDGNSDGSLNLSDAVFTLTHLFRGGRRPWCFKAADTDDSGSIDLADPVLLLNYLFLSGDPLPAPALECGFDRTADELSCDSFVPCDQEICEH